MQPSATDSLRTVLDDAQAQARTHRQDFVGTDHLLLALLSSTAGQAASLLKRERLPIDDLRVALEKQLAGGKDPVSVDGNLPLSPKAQRAFNNAIVMAQSLRETRVTTRHLLMSLLNDGSNPFLSAVGRSGGDPDALTRALAKPPTEPEA